ncbi:MATE family efflux transporter [Simiduia agarivorans]|uniref:MATE efflux family protein n=1 Tax=Simiduia agarivorans (strain DSM 21679 / JCM 13881 / BCRC 17597 / SA1) TaxID=1117647 RepID=K4KKD7_SIMAS|nr:MATE family efflux transporter [Simiduia agarivorans]AFU99624.1 MATE efflux family protein [Simiduia agarivorans SA1 = DSM 21679]
MTENSYRLRLWTIAWPLILTNLTQPLLGIVDTALLGHLPDARYIGATALGGSLLALVFWGFGFLRMGTTSLVARAYGAGEIRLADHYTRLSLHLAAMIALALWLVAPWSLGPAIGLMGSSAEVAESARSYSLIRLAAAPATLCNYVLLGWFIARQDSRRPLVVALTTQLLNLLLDILFILVLDLKSDGAALASAISEYLGLFLFAWFFIRKNPGFSLFIRENRSGYGELFQINRDLMVRTCCLLASFLFFTSQGAQQGDVVLAANAILIQWVHLVSYGLDGLAHATEALTGEAHGENKPHRQRQILHWASIDSLWVAGVFSALLWLGKDTIIALFTGIAPVQAAVHDYVVWVLILPPLSVAAYVLDGFAIGTGASRAMRNSMLVSCFLVFLPTWWLTLDYANHGLWLALTLFNVARGCSLGALTLPALRHQLRQN